MTELDPCVSTHCINPPEVREDNVNQIYEAFQPSPGYNLVSTWDGLPVEFGASVLYRCQPGLYFEEDRDKVS